MDKTTSGDSLMTEHLANQSEEGGLIPTSPFQYMVRGIPPKQTHEWLLKKHYAHRIPSISYAYGLYDKSNILQGVCTFGYPPNYEYNDGVCVFEDYKCTVLELNRLCVNDNMPPNSLSYFVARALRLIPIRPLCIVSYSDPNHGHRGYIYQATNWLYTGESTHKTEYTFASGEKFDIRRGIDKKGEIVSRKELLPTHRYLMLLGNKQQLQEMRENLKMPILPYPKGDNQRYDASYAPQPQGVLL